MAVEGAAAGFPAEVTAEDANVRLWTRGVDPLTATVVEAQLSYASADAGPEAAGRTRVVAFAGPQATLRGVAQLVAWIANLADGASRWVDVDTVARALVYYAAPLLRITPGDGGALTLANWRVGVRLPLPIEIELGQDGTVTRLVTSTAKLSEWARAPHFETAWEGLVNAQAAPLPVPDPDAVATEIKADLGKPWDPAVFADRFRVALELNPYEPVFGLVEALSQLRRDHADRRVPFVLHVVDPLVPRRVLTAEQTAAIAWTTGGHAAFRAFWRVLKAADPGALSAEDAARLAPARERMARALGLKAKDDGGWHDPTEIGPSVVPVEPPLTGRQATVRARPDPGGSADRNPLGDHEMVLGRNLTVGPRKLYKGVPPWRGPAYIGEKDPVTFFAKHPNALGTGATPEQRSALDVALTIGANEGKLDACRAQDSALLSTGLQQWSIHTNTEMTVLLHRFERVAPEHYDLFFGMYGVKTVKWAPGWNDAVLTPRPSETEIAKGNKYDVPAGEAGASPYGADFPSVVTLRRLPPGEDEKPLPETRPGITARFEFFGGRHTEVEVPDPRAPTKKRVKVVNELSGAWTARIRIAALVSNEYCAQQLQKAVFRFQRVLDAPRPTWPPVFTTAPRLQQLFSSQFAAALLLDFHVQRPGELKDLIERALERTLATAPSPYTTGTTTLDPAWLTQFAVDFMLTRPEFTSEMKKRNAHILAKHGKALDAKPGSFKGWATP